MTPEEAAQRQKLHTRRLGVMDAIRVAQAKVAIYEGRPRPKTAYQQRLHDQRIALQRSKAEKAQKDLEEIEAVLGPIKPRGPNRRPNQLPDAEGQR